MNLPVLYTKRLIIRPLAVSDAEDMFEYAQTNLVGPKAGWAPHINLNETINILRNMELVNLLFAWRFFGQGSGKLI